MLRSEEEKREGGGLEEISHKYSTGRGIIQIEPILDSSLRFHFLCPQPLIQQSVFFVFVGYAKENELTQYLSHSETLKR